MSKVESKVEILNQTKGKHPSLPFVDLKDDILGKKYELSIAFVGKKKSQELNKKFRQKDYPTNILSFELSKNSGELVINLECVYKDAPNFEMKQRAFLGFLLIHGMLHLKGYGHGSTMEKQEKKYASKFGYLKHK
jgi:probable rRNA maturation factor